MESEGAPARGQQQLTVFEAVAMAIGGMVGGGIFAVLGEAVAATGNAAFLSFGAAGVLALITGISYSRLTVSFDEPGGGFTFIEHLAGASAAGTVSWFLLLGYVFTISLYSYTFGAYAADLFGLPAGAHGYLGCLIVVGLAAINLMGIREAGLTEDLLVYGKIAILLLVAGTGLAAVERAEMLPVFEHGAGNILTTAALIFVAYEGFQLLTYDYDDIEDHKRNLPRAVYISIPVVAMLYALVAFVATGALSNATIHSHTETTLAYAAEPVLGNAGLVVVMIAAVLSTASAINATMFATGRLALRIGRDRQLPAFLTRVQRGGVPVAFVAASSLIAIGVQFIGSLKQITTFSSLVFLAVFAVVNVAALVHGEYKGWQVSMPVVGAAGCLAAIVMLVRDMYSADSGDLSMIAGAVALLIVLRVVYVGWQYSLSGGSEQNG